MRSSPHHNFHQVHRGRPLDDDNVLHGSFLSGSSQLSQTRRSTRRAQEPRGSFRYRRRLFFSFVVGSSFVGASISIATRPSKLLCFGLSSKLSFKRGWVTQGLLCTPPGVALDKTSRTSKRKFAIKTRPQSILSRRTSAFGQGPDGAMREEISIFPKVIASPTPPWPSSKCHPGILETSPLPLPTRLSTSRHTLCGLRMARSLTGQSGRIETPQKTNDSLGNLRQLKRLT